jgi:ketosteroid isomerase-like protein
MEPLDIVLTYHRAWSSGDIDAAIKLLADSFVCQAPSGAMGKEKFR